jgi:hypothetical protein
VASLDDGRKSEEKEEQSSPHRAAMLGHVQIRSNMPVSIRSSGTLVQNLENLTTKTFFSFSLSAFDYTPVLAGIAINRYNDRRFKVCVTDSLFTLRIAKTE